MSGLYECTERCSSVIHGDITCAALTKRNLTDTQLCTFLNKICCNCGLIKDCLGRTSLHMAASCGRTKVAKWLINHKQANINCKDSESGYTPLHRSIYYGKLETAVTLIKLGACLNITDNDGLSVFDHAMKDLKLPLESSTSKSGELYVWGQNANYTLGPQAKSVPERLDSFHKDYSDLEISSVCLDKFHSILLTADGKVFASGHGQGGRLGLSTEETILFPKQIIFGKTPSANIITQISIARDHSVFLTESGQVFTCGLNSHKVLGLTPPPPSVLSPRLVQINDTIIGISASRYHTVAFTNKKIYTWGLNAGQLGLDKAIDRYVVSPKLVTFLFGSESKINMVVTSNGATVVYTTQGDIYVLHEYQCRKIASRQLNIISISVVGGKLNSDKKEDLASETDELKLIALNNSGIFYLWRENYPQFLKCVCSIERALIITHITLNINDILLVTTEGEAFQGTIKPKKHSLNISTDNAKKSSSQDFLGKEDFHYIKIKKIPRIHRGFAVFSDLRGLNFAVLQYNPKKYQRLFPDISPSCFSKNLESLLENTHEDDDIHDIVFKVNNRNFPAHKYMCALASEKLEKLVSKNTNDNYIVIENENDYIFSNLLKFIYTGTCDLLEPNKYKNCCKLYESSINKEDNQTDERIEPVKLSVSPKNNLVFKSNPIFALLSLAKKLGVKTLSNFLEGVTFANNIPIFKQSIRNCHIKKPQRELFPQFYDAKIVSKEKKVIAAHKCILVSRMEYFENLFSVRWNMNSSSNEISLPFPAAVLELLIDYLYLDELNFTIHLELDLACNLLIAADHFLLIRLREICELCLSSHISLKNVAQLIQFSHTYNAPQLKDCCMEFILHNLPAILELKILETVEDVVLHELSEFYVRFNKTVGYRALTPYSTAPPDEQFNNASDELEITLSDIDDNEVVVKSVTKTSKKRHKSRKSSGSYHKKDTSNNTEKIIIGSDKENTIINNDDKDNNKIQSELISKNIDAKNRVRAIISAQDKISFSGDNVNYEILSPKPEIKQLNEEEFPLLGKDVVGHHLSQSPGKAEKNEYKIKFNKLSQKQRKRLTSEGATNEKELTPIAVTPKNPWKKIPDLVSPVGSPEEKTSIDSIIINEKKMKENLVKIKSKSLVYTQIEENAIEDLIKFYNVNDLCDEIVLVTRVRNEAIASPVWIHSNKLKT